MSGVVLHLRIRINLSLNVIVCCYKEIAEAPARCTCADVQTIRIDFTYFTRSLRHRLNNDYTNDLFVFVNGYTIQIRYVEC